MYQGAVKRRSNRFECSQVQKVASLVARPVNGLITRLALAQMRYVARSICEVID
jgi:hypothetical protein